MVRKALVGLVCLFASQASNAQEVGNRLSLVCMGSGASVEVRQATGFGWNSEGQSGNAVVNQTVDVPYEDQLQLWIEGGEGKARVPRVLLPPLHGGDQGWFEIKGIAVKDNEITGSVSINFINHPKLVLDRLTGTVTLSGKVGSFNGRCQKFDPATAKRAF